MSRTGRKKSLTGIYHIMLRGVDRRIIFADDEDCERFLKVLQIIKIKADFKLYAYCLMGNHFHLLIKEGEEAIDRIFRRLGASYVHYYNRKYDLHGHLFQDRFQSECVETDAYFLDVFRYICQNPVKAGLCEKPIDYRWLGCAEVTEGNLLVDGIADFTDMRRKDLIEFINTPCRKEHLEDTGVKRLTDKEAIKIICDRCKCEYAQEIGGWTPQQRETVIRKAIGSKVSIRQLSRLTGISKAVIERVLKRL